jgi:hypothetical protein
MGRDFWRIKKANIELVSENTSLHERIRGEFLIFRFCLSGVFVFHD